MGQLVPVCMDAPPPAENSDISSCTSIVLVDSQNLQVVSGPRLSTEDVADLSAAIMLLFATAFAVRYVRRVIHK